MNLAEFVYYINESADKSNNSKKIRELSNGQHPDFTLVTCSDSRLKLDKEFDLGKIFAIREMGSILNDSSIASIEYSMLLDVKKILFISHTNCGAIKACFNFLDNNENLEKKEILKSKFLTKFIETNINQLNLKFNQDLNEAIIKNEEIQIGKLLNKSSFINNKLKNKEIEIVTAQYSTETGKIRLLKNCIYNDEKIIFIPRMEYELLLATKKAFIKNMPNPSIFNKAKTKIV